MPTEYIKLQAQVASHEFTIKLLVETVSELKLKVEHLEYELGRTQIEAGINAEQDI